MHSNTELEVFYDGGCPACRRDIALMQSRNSEGRVSFIDIDSEGFDPSLYNKSLDQLMSLMHGRTMDGQWLIGVAVFARMYGLLGFRRLAWLLNAPLIRPAAHYAYLVFAHYRPKRCKDGVCSVD